MLSVIKDDISEVSRETEIDENPVLLTMDDDGKECRKASLHTEKDTTWEAEDDTDIRAVYLQCNFTAVGTLDTDEKACKSDDEESKAFGKVLGEDT